jgi:hypothetical protein
MTRVQQVDWNHWLDASALARVHRQLGRLVRPGGIVLNGDDMRRCFVMAAFVRSTSSGASETMACRWECPDGSL